jgi:catechol 2,3-dioxygenase-like lactoylglutathione lyase family enzyme
MNIDRIDHIVLTVASIDITCDFYSRVLGMRVERFGGGRVALRFGDQKINLHQVGNEFEPKANRATAGSGDVCFITRMSMDEVLAHLARCGVVLIEGPVSRTGALGPITSVYFRDPDLNLIEVARYP